MNKELAVECAEVSNKLNNLLTAIHLRAGMLLQLTNDDAMRQGLQQVLEASQEAATLTANIRELSDRKL